MLYNIASSISSLDLQVWAKIFINSEVTGTKRIVLKPHISNILYIHKKHNAGIWSRKPVGCVGISKLSISCSYFAGVFILISMCHYSWNRNSCIEFDICCSLDCNTDLLLITYPNKCVNVNGLPSSILM